MSYLLKLLLPLLFASTLLNADTISKNKIISHIKTTVTSQTGNSYQPTLLALYQKSNFKPFWIDKQHRYQREKLIKALDNPLFNYKKKPFDLPKIKEFYYLLDNNMVDSSQKASLYAALDVMLTNSFVRLADFVVRGDVDWALVQKKLANFEDDGQKVKAVWEMQTKPIPKTEALYSAIQSSSVSTYLHSQLPMKKRYRALVKMLEKYRSLENFPAIPYTKEDPSYGDTRRKSVELIKKRLQITGELPKEVELDSDYDSTLQKAVEKFQESHNLQKENKISKVMLYYLNQPQQHYINQIITNLDKTKLYPSSFESEHIEINLPDFGLRYYNGNHKPFKSPLVVGRLDRPTPLFSDKLEYMTLNPTWTVPNNLVKKDLIPALRDNPYLLSDFKIKAYQMGREVEVDIDRLSDYEENDKYVPFRFVQQPGENNALGKVKFMFPNKYSVYLHDTDNKYLFTRRYRLYSSGCVRLEKPMEMMHLLLKHSYKKYSDGALKEILESNVPTTIRLKKHIPVHVLYFTAYQEEGINYFRNDVYLYDQIIQESIRGLSKKTFEMPDKRLISVDKNAQQTGLSN